MSTAGAIRTEKLMTLEEYLAFEEKSPVRHEYHAGHIYAMAGGSPAHADIIQNTAYALAKRLEGKPCRVTSSAQRVRVEASDAAVYPDLLVKCPPYRFGENDPFALTNPALVVEVLSPATETYDRTDKLVLYSQIPELRDYLLISQDRVLVQHLHRTDSSEWKFDWANQREHHLVINHLGIELSVAEIYVEIDVPSGLIILNPPE